MHVHTAMYQASGNYSQTLNVSIEFCGCANMAVHNQKLLYEDTVLAPHRVLETQDQERS